MRFDITDLRLFVATVRGGSITRGAEALHLALASASERLTGMEAALGIPLLHRAPRGIRPTPAGTALMRHAEAILERSERMWGELRSFSTGQRGHVRLLANTSAVLSFVPRVLQSFLLDHPGIDVAVEERPSVEIIQHVTDRHAELGIVADIVDPGGLHVHKLEEDRLVLVTAASHHLAGRSKVPFAEVLHEPFVGLLDAALEAHLAEHATRHGARPEHRIRLRSVGAIGRMVAAGIGVAILPASSLAELDGLPVRAIPLADPWSQRRLALCVKRPDHLPRHAGLLMRHIIRANPVT